VDGDTHRAQDVSQTVFADLARVARTLSEDVMLGGWLHRHTCFVASKLVRGERRRKHRERQAVEMNALEDHSAANLKQIAPFLDAAIDELGDEDRKAVLLRFFEQRDFRSLGEALGSSEEAARKRVNRALDKLHLLLGRRGVALSAAALGTALGAGAVTAAPAGIAASAATAALAGAATTGAATLTILQIMSMTKVKLAVAGAVVIAATIPYVVQNRAQTALRAENETLRQQAGEIDRLTAENERLAKLAAARPSAAPGTNDQFREVLKLRGEVGRLRKESASVAAALAEPKGPSALADVTARPEMLKAIREQQKMAMSMVYKDFAKRLNLPEEQKEKLNDLLADDVMEGVGHVTTVLRERKSVEEADRLFAAQESALQEKVQRLLGPEALAQFNEYTRDLLSHLSAEQFKPFLSGDKAKKDEQTRQIYQLMQEEKARALASAGLSADFQAIPNLNFRNFASESEADKNLRLLDSIYEQVIQRSTSFLSPEEVQKFNDFRVKAIDNNRLSLIMNRKMMSPSPQ
jgi:RNA polymerase sigma factor (sigma-70 family)